MSARRVNCSRSLKKHGLHRRNEYLAIQGGSPLETAEKRRGRRSGLRIYDSYGRYFVLESSDTPPSLTQLVRNAGFLLALAAQDRLGAHRPLGNRSRHGAEQVGHAFDIDDHSG